MQKHPMTIGAAAIAATLAAPACLAATTGMTVVAGAASLATSGTTTTITSHSTGTLLNWRQFSIPEGRTVRFDQPNAASTVLNRVVGSDPSQIYGRLTSNGQVWLINPNGIVVGPSGRIDTAGFLASTLSITDADAQAGKFKFKGDARAGSISNRGTITVGDGGSVYLIAPQVDNAAGAVISASTGQIMLLAGHTVTLASTATPGVYYQVDAPVTHAVNLGRLLARDVLLQGQVVRNGGRISADSVTEEGGRIFLKASRTATLDAGASLSANGTRGGVVAMEGDTVSVAGNISATGSRGAGGTVILSGTPDIGASAAFTVAGTSPGSIYTSPLGNEFDGTASGWMVSDGWTNGGFFNSVWQADNARTADGELQLSITPCPDNCQGRPYASGETMSLSRLGYGTYSTRLKAASGSGVVTSLFTYNGAPWDEIDVEILGRNTTRVEFNYYKNGVGGHERVVDLGFDAAAGYHDYAIKWTAGRIAWYVDGVLKHQVTGNNLPATPGRAMVNLWPAVGVDDWTGAYAGTPATANYQYVRYTPETASLPTIKAGGVSANFAPRSITPPSESLTTAPVLAGLDKAKGTAWTDLDQAEIEKIMAPKPEAETNALTNGEEICSRQAGILVCLPRPEKRLPKQTLR